MVASNRTIAASANVLLSHMPRSQALAVLDDLLRVQGNSSFEATISLLREEVEVRSDVLLPPGVEYAAPVQVNEARGFFCSTDLDRLGEPMIRADNLRDAAVAASRVAENYPGNTILLTACVAAYKRPLDRGGVLRLPLVPYRQV